MKDSALVLTPPWWKFGYVWLVIGGPALVVVASLVTVYIAVSRPDPLVTQDYYRKGLEINRTLGNETGAASLAPALQARNHAATGVPAAAKAVHP